jgi:hypothetical protein
MRRCVTVTLITACVGFTSASHAREASCPGPNYPTPAYVRLPECARWDKPGNCRFAGDHFDCTQTGRNCTWHYQETRAYFAVPIEACCTPPPKPPYQIKTGGTLVVVQNSGFLHAHDSAAPTLMAIIQLL